MDADRDEAQESALEQATDWLIQLQESPENPDLLRRFDAWLAASSGNAAAWAATDHVAGVIARTPPSFVDRWRPLLEADRAGRSASLLSAPRPARRRAKEWLPKCMWSGRLGSFLAGAVVAGCLAFLVVSSVGLRLYADYVTGTAEMRTIRLTDGTAVVLAPDTAIRIGYQSSERRVALLSGEAFFSVVHDAARPFRVGVGAVEATALGTAFDVRRGKDGASITVQHGSVRVDYPVASPPVSETLTDRWTLQIAWSGAFVRREQPAGEIAAWRQNQLIARDEPMQDVVDRLRPYFSGTIIMATWALGHRPVTGVYNLAAPVEALRGIAQAQGGSVYQISPWLLVVFGA